MTRTRTTRADLDWIRIGIGVALVFAAFAVAPAVLANDAPPISPAAQAEAQKLAAEPPVAPPGNGIVDDHSGRKEAGTASIYAHSFDGKTMADGQPYDPHASVAASKTLPFGTVAKVTNLETGKSTEVKIEDRGPFVAGRVVDLAPHAAAKIGLSTKEGLAPVIVAPVTVPQTDGSLKPGAGAAEEIASKP